jgi:WD40 repeat protein
VLTGQLKATLTGPGSQPGVSGLAFSPNGATLVTGDWGGNNINLWDVATGRRVITLTSPAPVQAVAFSPDGKTLAIGSDNGSTYLWHVA